MSQAIKVFIDTEFTSLEDAHLISIGLISETNKEIYLETNNWQTKQVSNFCREKVIPLLNNHDVSISPQNINLKLKQWFSQFEDVTIMVDNNIDIRLFVNLFDQLPNNISQAYDISEYIKHVSKILWFNSYPNHYEKAATKLINRFFFLTTQYYSIEQISSHHAMSDAKANKYAFEEIEKYFNYPITQILQQTLSY